MKNFYWKVIVAFLFIVGVGAYGAEKIRHVDTNDGYTLTVAEGCPGVAPQPSILVKENVKFTFDVSITKKEGDKVIFIEEVSPTNIKKVTYTLQASGATAIKPDDFELELGKKLDAKKYPLQYKKEINSGSLLTNVSILCRPQKGSEYSVQLTVAAETKNGKTLKPDPVELKVLVDDAIIIGYIKKGEITTGGQSFDINAGKNKYSKKWPIGHIAWKIEVGKECIERLNELTNGYTAAKTNEVNNFKAEQRAEITRLTNEIRPKQESYNLLFNHLRGLQTQLNQLYPINTRDERQKETQLKNNIRIQTASLTTIKTQLNQLEARKAEAERDLAEANRRSTPAANNNHKVGFGAAYIDEFKSAENIIARGQIERRKNFNTLSVQGRLFDDNQGQAKSEQTNIEFFQKATRKENKLTLENAANGLQFICDHWGKKDNYGPAYNCVDMANDGFHAASITKVTNTHVEPCRVKLKVIYIDKNKKVRTDGVIHLSLPEKYKIEMERK
ncbi:MAG: hypothetical protein LBT09_06305 [Planctomycetaceae bacterium]|jgi:hypothetical protein|nr:hypothetical protein [Planctomycetaceae bacterium]